MFAMIEPSIWADPSPWLHTFGRAHVVLVHFPIAVLIIMLLFEAGSILGRLVGRGSIDPPPTNTVISLLVIGLIVARATKAAMAPPPGRDRAKTCAPSWAVLP